ncbi:tRNA pseudouridine(55) synthase TruB [Neptunicella sp. SCSIO 80796]|uniref:tRNA pseudouridine(55) synthase TruB n=1 Tax=Neptunicella plasticusilytica TaxID=3117012 RepID=UPI003A4E1829
MARRSKGRAINGIVLLNKPLDFSSNQALQKVKGIFYASKAGHTGALDPLATGMLPVCLGEATKFSQFLLDADKAYLVTARLGIRTTTSDADGEVVAEHPVNVTEQQLLQACEQFRGPIKQVPSMFSALKHQGKPLYYYARQGIDIPREARDITIYDLQIHRFENDEVDMLVRCSKGTYIRSLVDDLGQLLGCGAYVSALHRTEVADYPIEKMMTFEQLQQLRDQIDEDGQQDWSALDDLLLPMDTAVESLPQVEIPAMFAAYFMNGQAVKVANAPCEGQVRVYVPDGTGFVGVGQIDDDGKVAPKRLVVL